MLNDALVFLKDSLNTYLKLGNNDFGDERVVFPDGQSNDALNLKSGAISMLLLNIEQDKVLRSPDLYMRYLPDGKAEKVEPEIRLNLFILLVANFSQYDEALRNLSQVIRYFQKHRLFTHQNATTLNQNIEQLTVELLTPPFSEQNEIWGALRSSYRPSILYKVKTLTFEDDGLLPIAPIIEDKDIRLLE